MNRAAEEAAIATHIAMHGVTILPEADSVERAVEIWRQEKAIRSRSKKSPMIMKALSRGGRGRPRGKTQKSELIMSSGMPDREQMVRELAYNFWERDGCAHGHDQEHWLRAEKEIEKKR